MLAIIICLYQLLSGKNDRSYREADGLDKGLVVAGPDYNAFSTPNTRHRPSTTQCTIPRDPKKPLVQYVVMIDARSTGSRVHVYKFNNCGETLSLEDEGFRTTEKRYGGSGLSSYTDPTEASASLDGLMRFAESMVPKDLYVRTPVAVKATAGLRLLGTEIASTILEAVKTRLESRFPFPVAGVEVMNGDDEAAFAWLSANYLLGNFDFTGIGDVQDRAAILDLGGGSLQVVFQTFSEQDSGAKSDSQSNLGEDDHGYRLDFRGGHIRLYQHSYLGYGLMAARKALHQLVLDRTYKHSVLSKPVFNPCLPPASQVRVTIEMPVGHTLSGPHEVIMEGPVNDSDPEHTLMQCRRLLREILHKDDTRCSVAPCSINGVYQPSIEETISGDIYVLSYFYDRTHPLGMQDSFTLPELRELIFKVCVCERTSPSASGDAGSVLRDLKEMPEWCLDLQYMEVLLHDGFEVAHSRQLRVTDKINGYEVGWCLGASLALLEDVSVT